MKPTNKKPSIKSREAVVRNKINAEEFDGCDEFWFRLVGDHPESYEKIGCGISRFTRKRNVRSGYYELHITRIDGSTIDVSWKKCVSGKKTSAQHLLWAAMRHAIKNQISTARKDLSGFPCFHCEENFEGIGHIDHYPVSFKTLAIDFVSTCVAPQSFKDNPETNETMFCDNDKEFKDNWEAFHKRSASLCISCPTCNLSRSKR